MKKFLAAALAATTLYMAGAPALADPTPGREQKTVSIYDVQTTTLEGKAVKLSAYKGKVMLVVNTASQCGYTPQYEGLEKLYERYEGKGLVVLGFPSNDFGGQEPGTSQEIRQFCNSRYHVTFPMFSKVVTRAGADQSEVYRILGASGHLPRWNFGKYLIGRDGHIIAFYDSNVTPDDKTLQTAIDQALATH